jgi:DNA mismatch repair protein MLH1
MWNAVLGEADPGRNTGKEVPESLCEFASILELRRAVKKAGNRGESSFDLVLYGSLTFLSEITEMMQKHAFVGTVDKDLCLSLLQHGTKLFLVNHATLG